MSKEALRYTPPSRKTVEKIINHLKGDYIDLIPRLEQVYDEAELRTFYGDEELFDLLEERGLTPGQKRVVNIALGEIINRHIYPPITVGEVRRMADEELLQSRGRGRNIGPRKLKIIRKLFGKIPEDNNSH
jgi:hypothetical protein